MPRPKKQLSVEDRVLKYVKKYMVSTSEVNNFLFGTYAGNSISAMVGEYMDHLESKCFKKDIIARNLMHDMILAKAKTPIDQIYFYTHHKRCIDAKEVKADGGKGSEKQLRLPGNTRKVYRGN
jgi:hypothetical protein